MIAETMHIITTQTLQTAIKTAFIIHIDVIRLDDIALFKF